MLKPKIIYNGTLTDADTSLIGLQSKGLRFGEGCFETMRVINNRIILKDFHFARLFSSLELLSLPLPETFSPAALVQHINQLVLANQHEQARVRLTVVGGEGSLYDGGNALADYFIESTPLPPHSVNFNTQGLVLDIYKEARKAADHFSHLKSNNFLPYLQAAKWARQHELDDAIVLNCADRIADTTIANIFIVANGIIKTPVLTEGCIAGVMRKYVINCCRKEGIPVLETQLTVDDLLNASEVFLTNAIRGIRWVQQVGESGYSSAVSRLLQQKFIKPLWS